MSPAFVQFLDAIAFILLLTLLTGLWRVFRGPTPEDRMLAGQLFGTTGVGVLVVLSISEGAPPIQNVAVVLALLAIVTVSAFVGRVDALHAPDTMPDDTPASARAEVADERA